MGIENIDVFKAEIEGRWRWPPVPRAYIVVPDMDPSTTWEALSKFRKKLRGRSVGYYTANNEWTHGIKPIVGDLLCFYHDKEPLFSRGVPVEELFYQALAREKKMMVFEGMSCYEILEAR